MSDDPKKKLNSIQQKLEVTREKMEIETLVFIEATKQFASRWIQREIETAAHSPENSSFPENLIFDNKVLSKSNLYSKELPIIISDIVETHLNLDDYWIHRNKLFQPDLSRDYIEFKKEKIRTELTSSVRRILGCITEIFWKLKEGEPESKVWVKELGKRKYTCFLRFSDEMTTSMNRYFELLEELFLLNYEMQEAMLRIP